MIVRTSCSASALRPCSPNTQAKIPQNPGGVRMIFADRGKPAQERAADIDFAFRDPALLGLDPAFKSRIPIDRIFDCAARRRGLILRERASASRY